MASYNSPRVSKDESVPARISYRPTRREWLRNHDMGIEPKGRMQLSRICYVALVDSEVVEEMETI